jgi:hypothetical protein
MHTQPCAHHPQSDWALESALISWLTMTSYWSECFQIKAQLSTEQQGAYYFVTTVDQTRYNCSCGCIVLYWSNLDDCLQRWQITNHCDDLPPILISPDFNQVFKQKKRWIEI